MPLKYALLPKNLHIKDNNDTEVHYKSYSASENGQYSDGHYVYV